MATSEKKVDSLGATAKLMQSKDYKERFIAEYRQTKIRYDRLRKFCDTIEVAHEYKSVPMPKHDCSLGLLRDQQALMGQLLHILEMRAIIEHIEL